MYKAQPACGGRALRLRARSPRLYHTSYPVRVPRPARSFHAAFRPHLAVTPLRFPCPSAPRIPGQGTFTPKHDRMHGTHALVQRRRASAVRCNRWLGRAITSPLTVQSFCGLLDCLGLCGKPHPMNTNQIIPPLISRPRGVKPQRRAFFIAFAALHRKSRSPSGR